ncbi:MAG: zinc ABC transporter substrate-binding protein [Bacilli bacterium]|nr:zinc ABC transporter substrate-binding protein [Bacilli bacterium]
MKKISFLLILIICLTGCIKMDTMENINVYTTNYSTFYITKRLYGKYSKVKSIYPNGVNIDEYNLTDKQIKDYSSSDLFIFNGLSNEKKYISKMRDYNKDLRIIDTTLSMEYVNDISELWLNPSNFLMMASNIKKGLNEYIDSYYLNNKIKENFENLKVEISSLDAKYQDAVKGSSYKAIITSNKVFKYLEKYGLTVYVLDENDSNFDITLAEVKGLIKKGLIKYVYVKNNEEVNSSIKSLMDTYNITSLSWYTLENLSEEEVNDNEDYFTLMNKNLDSLKNELYK